MLRPCTKVVKSWRIYFKMCRLLSFEPQYPSICENFSVTRSLKLYVIFLPTQPDCSSSVEVRQPSHNMNRAAVVWRTSCGWLVLWASFLLYPPTRLYKLPLLTYLLTYLLLSLVALLASNNLTALPISFKVFLFICYFQLLSVLLVAWRTIEVRTIGEFSLACAMTCSWRVTSLG